MQGSASEQAAAANPTLASFTIDADQRVVEWDRGAELVSGISRRDAQGQPCYELFQGKDASGRKVCGPGCPALRSIRAGHVTGQAALGFVKDAQYARLRCRLTKLPPPHRGAVAELSEQPSEGPSLARWLAALATLTSSLDPSSAGQSFGKALDIVREATHADTAELFLTETDGSAMVLTTCQGLFRRAFCQILRFRYGEGYPGLVLAEGQPLVSYDLSGDDRYLRTAVKSLGFSSYVCVPVRGARGVLGSLQVAFRDEGADLESSLTFLSWASVPLALAVEQAMVQLRESVRPSTRPAAERVEEAGDQQALREAVGRLVRSAGADGGAVRVVHPCKGAPEWTVVGETGPHSLPKLDDFERCPAFREGRAVVRTRGSNSWPEGCPGRSRFSGVGYCIPLLQDGGLPLGVALVHYQRSRFLPPSGNLAMVEAAAADVADLISTAQQRAGSTGQGREIPQEADPAAQGYAPLPPPPVASRPATVESEREEATGTPYLDVRCLGPFHLYRNGEPVTADQVHRRKALALLKILALQEGRPVSKDTLIEWLWPEGDPGRRTNQLYVLVHELRQLLEPQEAGTRKWLFVCNQGDRYYLNTQAPCRIDVTEFKELIVRGRKAEAAGETAESIAAYEAAANLYHGDLLAEDTEADWWWEDREELKETCLEALSKLAALLGEQGAWSRSAWFLRRALKMDPPRESLHRQLMYALWAMGRRDEAIRQYHTCEGLLRQELDVSPLPETVELLHRIQEASRPQG